MFNRRQISSCNFLAYHGAWRHNIQKECNRCPIQPQSRKQNATLLKGSPSRPRRVSSYVRRCTIFARENTVPRIQNRPSPLVSPRHDVPGSWQDRGRRRVGRPRRRRSRTCHERANDPTRPGRGQACRPAGRSLRKGPRSMHFPGRLRRRLGNVDARAARIPHPPQHAGLPALESDKSHGRPETNTRRCRTFEGSTLLRPPLPASWHLNQRHRA